jgi:GDPmannose 4,6-dehydratase
MRIAFITGITGQDGSYLAELLLEKEYIVHGLIRRISTQNNTIKIQHILDHPNLILHHGDVMDGMAITRILNTIEDSHPNFERFEIYNLAAQSHVQDSINVPEFTAHCNGNSLIYLLEWIAHNKKNRSKIRLYQASTSELFGKVQEWPQNERTPFYPRSPYGVAKLYAFWIVKNYRESYNIFVINGILFNHESPRRGHDFITRKITLGLHDILNGTKDCIEIGNLNAIRDWGHAKDFVYGMWLMMQYSEPRDWVLATGETHTVREFISKAFSLRNISLVWKNEGINEIGVDQNTEKTLIKINPKYFRPAEVDKLCGDSSDIINLLKWEKKYTFENIVKDMVDNDCQMMI